jgi:L-Ala-D/L-Glu epimerase
MRILSVESSLESLGLTRPYRIASRSVTSAENVIVTVKTARQTGFGAAAPDAGVTGETLEACRAALAPESLRWLAGEDVREIERLCRTLATTLGKTPAACAAVDMALHDLLARELGIPLVRLLGQAHESLPTSVTIGIRSVEETLREADEHVGRGFLVLKVKMGLSLDEDVERLSRLRERVGRGVRIRADANMGYGVDETRGFFERTESLDIEFLEQPGPPESDPLLQMLPEPWRRRMAADESLHGESDALRLLSEPRPFGIFNVKLMKCGGIRPARRIATLAETAGVKLMWGCMDESAISISAALHAALSSPATRYLDLDGSFDLARDVVRGGFALEDGMLRPSEASGLGVEPL